MVSTCDPLTHDPLTDDYVNHISKTNLVLGLQNMRRFTVISLVAFTRADRLLVRPTSCYQPEPNFIVTEIPGQNLIFCVGVTDVQTIGNNHNS